MKSPPPIDGVSASRLQLPPGPWRTVLEALCARFPAVTEATWRERFRRGRVLDASGAALDAGATYRVGMEVFYYREVDIERRLPEGESILHIDEHLIVADKPHFLPVVPSGGFVTETLLARLVRRTGNPDLAPLHRIDRLTAGLVLFSAHRDSRERYQSLFREQRIHKRYEAVAPAMPTLPFPAVHRSRIEPGEPFFRMREAPGDANSHTRVDVIERGGTHWRYALEPVTGRKHQLRVHMAALGAPILHDPLYPVLAEQGDDDFERPLQLLAKSLAFTDPIDGRERAFESRMALGRPG